MVDQNSANNDLPWLAAGSAIGAMMAGPAGAVAGFLIGAVAKGINDSLCPRCGRWMSRTEHGELVFYTCPNCSFQRIEQK